MVDGRAPSGVRGTRVARRIGLRGVEGRRRYPGPHSPRLKPWASSQAHDRERLHREAGRETLAEEHVALLNPNLGTKADIAAVKTDIEALRQQARASIEAVNADFLKWLFGAPIAQGGLIVALVRLPWPGALSRAFASRS